MRNVNNPGQQANESPLGVSVTIDEAPLLQSLVEKLAHRRYDIGYGLQAMPSGWQAVETSTIEAFVSGCMDMYGCGEPVSLSYTTCFSFTCTKLSGEDNNLAWVNSLS
jgi:hypothetical protein